MSEHKEPIPSMIYNSAVGGHVTNSQQIIDENLNREQQDINEEVAAIPYNASNPNGMGKIVLKKTDNFKQVVEAQTDGNTIFVIKYDFTLTGNVTVPANCILKFEGGSLNGNYILTLNKTYIQGNAKFDVTLAGDVSNEVFNVLWMKGNDIGEQINKAGVNFKALIVPQGNYTFTTPVVLSGISYLNCLATLKYNGIKKNCEGIFLVKNFNSAEIHFNSLEPTSEFVSTIDYTDNRTENVVGLEFRTCSNSKFFINHIGYFNENLRLAAHGGGECCNHIWFLGVLNNANFNIRIYQQGGGYCNENTFIGGHLAFFSTSATYGRKYYIGIGGPAIDLDSYLPVKPSDSYDSVNAIRFIDMDLEGSCPVFLSRNTTSFALLRNRYEGQTVKSKVYGSFMLTRYEPLYGDILNLIDFSDADKNYSNIPVSSYQTIVKLDNTFKGFGGLNIPYNMFIATLSGIVNEVRGNYNTIKGCIIDTSVYKVIKIKSSIKLHKNVYYLDNDNQNVTPNYSSNEYCPGGGSYFSPGPNGWAGWVCNENAETTLFIHNDINKIFVGIVGDSNGEITVFTQNSNLVSVNTLPTKGSTADRPIGLPASVPYYDTTLGKPIWYDGNSTTGWCDATGTAV